MKNLFIPSVVLLLVLTGCAAPEAMPTPDPATTSSDAPVDQDLVAPALRVGVRCANLVDGATVASWFTVEVTEDENTPVDTLDRAAVRTTGGSQCYWSGPVNDDGYRPDYVSVQVRPEADAAYGYDDATAYYIEDQYTEFDSVGDDSVLFCSVYGDQWSCQGEMLVSGYWVSAAMVAQETISESQAKQRVRNVLQRAASQLRNSAPTGEAWVLPTGVAMGEVMCGDDRSQTEQVIEQAWGLKGVQSYGGDVVYTGWETYRATKSKECGFGNDKVYVSISLLPGGAWWGDTWDGIDLRHWTGAEFTPESVEGADRAMVGCAADECVAYVIAGGSAWEIRGNLAREKFVAGLSAVEDLVAL